MPYTAIRPDQAGFGQEQAAYLAALQRGTGDPTADAINRITLMAKARNAGDGGYMQALREANANQLAGSADANQSDVAQAYFPAAAALAKEGVAGAVLPNGDNHYLRVDPSRLTGSDAIHQQGMQAEIVQKTGEGVSKLAEAGMAPTPATVGSMITPYLQPTPTEVTPYMSPKNKSDAENADSNRIKAEADMYDAKHGGQGRGGGGDKEVTTYISDGKGGFTPISKAVTSKGGGGPLPPTGGVDLRKTIIAPGGRVVPNPNYGKPK